MTKVFVWSVCFFVLTTVANGALIDNLQLYYNFNNDTLTPGGISDSSGNNRNGSPFDNSSSVAVGLTLSSNVPAAIGSGQSLQLTGVDSIRPDAWTGISGNGARTISLWVNTTATSNQPFVEWGTNTTGNRFTFRMENANTQPTAGASKIGGIRTEIQGDYRTTAAASPAINDGTWHHIAMVYDPGTTQLESVTMYIDGVAITPSDNTASVNINTILSGNVGIGGPSGGTGVVFNGLIDDVGIWNRALSAGEITQLASGAVPIPEPASAVLILLSTAGLLIYHKRR